MGARPTSFKKGGGGFLDGVEGVLTNYTFTDADPGTGEPFKPGKTKGPDGKVKDKFHSLFMRIEVVPDGAEEPVTTSLFAGGADDFKISDDGRRIWDAEYDTYEACVEAEAGGTEVRQIGANTAVAIFVTSGVEAGFPVDELPEFGIDYSAMVDRRYRYKQEVDAEATKKLGKRKSKDGKREFDRKNLVIDAVLGAVEGGQASAAAKPAAKTSAASAPAKGKATASASKKTSSGPDIAGESTTLLLEILAANGNAINKRALGNKILMTATKKKMDAKVREEVRKYLYSDDNLEALGEAGTIGFDRQSGDIVAAA